MPEPKTLEAPEAPAPPMTRTQKQRDDLAYVMSALRGEQRERDDEAGEPAPEDINDEPAVAAPRPTIIDAPADDGIGVPDWFRMNGPFPADVQPGTTVIFLRFPVALTGDPKRGERQCAARPLTVALEKFARSRAQDGDAYTLTIELTKAMICVADGAPANHFAKGPGSVNHFWQEIGPKCRDLLIGMFSKLNRVDAKERADFLSNCVAVRTVA